MFGWIQKLAIGVRPILKTIVKATGVAICSQLCYYLTTKSADAEGWVETPTEELAEATLCSRYQVERTRRQLVQLGLLEETRRYGNKIWSRPTGKRVQVVRYTLVYQLGNGRTRTLSKLRAFPENYTATEIEAALPRATSIVIVGNYSLLELYQPNSIPKPEPSNQPNSIPKPEPSNQPNSIPKPEPSKLNYYTVHQHPCERVDDRFKNQGALPEWKKSRAPQDYSDAAIESVMAYLASFAQQKADDPALRKKAISHLYKLEKEARFAEIQEILKTYKFNRFTSSIPARYRDAYPYYLIQRRIDAGELSNFDPDFVKFMCAPDSVHYTLKHYKHELEKLHKELGNEQNQTTQSG